MQLLAELGHTRLEHLRTRSVERCDSERIPKSSAAEPIRNSNPDLTRSPNRDATRDSAFRLRGSFATAVESP
jgi:hypothetical protein